MVLITNHQPTEVVEPGKQSLDFPPPAEPAQRSAILSPGRAAILFMGCNDFTPKLLQHLRIEPVAVIGFIAHQALRHLRHEALFNGLSDQLYFSWASTFCANGDRKTMAVGHSHDFGPLAPLSLSNQTPPFFAGTNVPSMKHSRRSSPPRSFRSWAMASSTFSNTLERTQFWNRRCTVWYGPYRRGRSFHGALVRRIQRIPLNTCLRSLHGRPRLSGRTRSCGRRALTTIHCCSVRSIHNILWIRH